jgi:hypothetical protein
MFGWLGEFEEETIERSDFLSLSLSLSLSRNYCPFLIESKNRVIPFVSFLRKTSTWQGKV